MAPKAAGAINGTLQCAHPESQRHVAISAWSAVTPLGSLEQTWNALLNGRYIDDHARCPVALPGDRAIALARVVAAPILQSVDPHAALIVGTSKGPVESWMAGGLEPSGLAQIAAEFPEIRGPRLTCSAACASGLNALIRGAMMIQRGEVTQALVLAAESSLHPIFIGSFQRLGVISPPGHGCRPFDEDRRGFVVSEAAAAVLLEAVSDCDGRALIVDRFALGGDATHLTGSDPEGALLRHLLHQVIDNRPVDIVHAHGTGTPANDPVELAAIESAAPNTPPILYSHKAALGHSLGAAGLLSLVINCQCHAQGLIPPNPRLGNPLGTSRAILSDRAIHRKVRRSIAIASGFGGPTAVVSLTSS